MQANPQTRNHVLCKSTPIYMLSIRSYHLRVGKQQCATHYKQWCASLHCNEKTYNGFCTNLGHWNSQPLPIAVVLNRGYTYPLGVPNTETGGTKHRHFYEYTPWKF